MRRRQLVPHELLADQVERAVQGAAVLLHLVPGDAAGEHPAPELRQIRKWKRIARLMPGAFL